MVDTRPESDPNAFRDWLRGELKERHWTVLDLARASGVHRTAIGQWLHPAGDPRRRTPRYDSLIRVADTLGVSRETVLDLAGVPYERSRGVSDRQREVMSLIPLLSDEALIVVEPMLRALASKATAERVRSALREAGEREVPASGE